MGIMPSYLIGISINHRLVLQAKPHRLRRLLKFWFYRTGNSVSFRLQLETALEPPIKCHWQLLRIRDDDTKFEYDKGDFEFRSQKETTVITTKHLYNYGCYVVNADIEHKEDKFTCDRPLLIFDVLPRDTFMHELLFILFSIVLGVIGGIIGYILRG